MKVGLTNIFDLTMGPGQIITDTITIPIQLLQTEDAAKGLNIAEVDDAYINSIPAVFKVRFKNTVYTNVNLHLFGQISTKPGIIIEGNKLLEMSTTSQDSVDQIIEYLQKELEEVLNHQVFEYESENTENIIQLEVETKPLKHIDVQLEIKDGKIEQIIEVPIETAEPVVEPAKAKKHVKDKKAKTTSKDVVLDTSKPIESTMTDIFDTLQTNLDKLGSSIFEVENTITEPVVEPVVELVKTKKTKAKTKKSDDYSDTNVTDLFTENIDLDREDLFNEKI